MSNLKKSVGRSAILSTLVVVGTASLYILSKGLTNRPQNTLQAQTAVEQSPPDESQVEQSQYSRALPEGFAQPSLNGRTVPLPDTNSDPVINGVRNPIRNNGSMLPVTNGESNSSQPHSSGGDFSKPAFPATSPTTSPAAPTLVQPPPSDLPESTQPRVDPFSSASSAPANVPSQPSSAAPSPMSPSSAALMPVDREPTPATSFAQPTPSATNSAAAPSPGVTTSAPHAALPTAQPSLMVQPNPAAQPTPAAASVNPAPTTGPAPLHTSPAPTPSSLAPSAVVPMPVPVTGAPRPFSTTALESNTGGSNNAGEGRYFNPRGEAVSAPATVNAPAIGAPTANPAPNLATAPTTNPIPSGAPLTNRVATPRAPAPTFGARSPAVPTPTGTNVNGFARTTIPSEPTRIDVPRTEVAARVPTSNATAGAGAPGLQPLESAERKPIAKVTAGDGTLPNSQRQIWREYEITPFTEKWATTPQVEQTIVDWILRETGYEAWHGDVVSILSADTKKLKVYHTPEMQGVVSEIVDRFVNPASTDEIFGMHVISLDSPMWRVKAQSILKPIAVQTPGVQAWTAKKEDAAILVSEFRKRTDYREHGNPQLIAANGQALKTQTLRARPFIQAVQQTSASLAGLQPIGAKVEEGSRLEFTPLVTIDGRTADIMIKCDIEQVEKLHDTQLSFPTPTGDKNVVKIETPQMSGAHLHEKFRWQKDQVLIIGLGVVPTPTPTDGGASFLPIMSAAPARADVLLFIEHRGKSNEKREAKQ